jgi:hypothetical protein
MKKMTKSLCVTAVALSAGLLTACSNDELPKTNDQDGNKTVVLTMDLLQPNQTRLVDDPIKDGAALTIKKLSIVFYNQNSRIILNRVNVDSLTTPSLPDLYAGKATFTDISSTADRVAIMANTSSNIGIGDNVDDAPAKEPIDITTQTEESKLNIFGNAGLVKSTAGDGTTRATTTDLYTAKVTVEPTEARFEIGGVTVGSDLQSLHVKAVYADEFAKKGSIDGLTITDHKAATSVSTNFSKDYPTTWKGLLYDEDDKDEWYGNKGSATGVIPVVPAKAAAPANNQVWGYYVFAGLYRDPKSGELVAPSAIDFTTSDKSAVTPPSFIIAIDQVTVDKTATGMASEARYNWFYYGYSLDDAGMDAKFGVGKRPASKTWYITISSYQVDNGASSATLDHIYGGTVFGIDAKDLVVSSSNLDEQPHAKKIDVAVTIVPMPWQKINLKPGY